MTWMGSLKRTRLYKVWHEMNRRCASEKHTHYKNYGGRGIKVCERWMNSFDNFYEDMQSTWEQGLQLDREDNNGNYEPTNCRWVTRSQNTKNRRNSSKIQSSVDYVFYEKNQEKWSFKVSFETQEEAEKLAKFVSLYAKDIELW